MKKHYQTLIIGTGCAGFNAADKLFDLGVTDIAILTEGRFMGTSRNTGSDKQTYYKLSLCGGEGDSVREMASTLWSGGGVMGEHADGSASEIFFSMADNAVPVDEELENYLAVEDEAVLAAVFAIFKEKFQDVFTFED